VRSDAIGDASKLEQTKFSTLLADHAPDGHAKLDGVNRIGGGDDRPALGNDRPSRGKVLGDALTLNHTTPSSLIAYPDGNLGYPIALQGGVGIDDTHFLSLCDHITSARLLFA
jgi:hypothetical protein